MKKINLNRSMALWAAIFCLPVEVKLVEFLFFINQLSLPFEIESISVFFLFLNFGLAFSVILQPIWQKLSPEDKQDFVFSVISVVFLVMVLGTGKRRIDKKYRKST